MVIKLVLQNGGRIVAERLSYCRIMVVVLFRMVVLELHNCGPGGCIDALWLFYCCASSQNGGLIVAPWWSCCRIAILFGPMFLYIGPEFQKKLFFRAGKF